MSDEEKATAYIHPRGSESLACLGDSEALAKLDTFSDGFYRIEEKGGEILVSDLRMGLTPNYVFSFAIAKRTAEGVETMAPERRRNGRTAEGDWDWLLANLAGEAALRPVETTAFADLGGTILIAQGDAAPASC